MSAPRKVFSRPDKLDHAQTVLYEIDMLRFAKERLFSADSPRSEADEWVYLEAFLLHYRNLIEFFRGRRRLNDDLSIAPPDDFGVEQKLGTNGLRFLTRPDLWDKYEGVNNPEAISKYLHHCTRQRAIKKKWDVDAMYEDLRPLVERFEAELPEYKPATRVKTLKVVAAPSQDGSSTATTRALDLGLNPSSSAK
ncbi:MAG: hypothetical protein ABSH01_01920 [Terriglobia bacterium]|jgi:hypothetical protein